MGFDPDQLTDSGQTALTVIYAWLPIVFKVTAIALVWNFALTERRLITIQRRLAGRRRFTGNGG
jgi:Na+/melibiose symporter-like transporter